MGKPCVLCGSAPQSVRTHEREDAHTVTCAICGVYEIEGIVWAMFENPNEDPRDRHQLSALTRTAPARLVGRVRVNRALFRDLKEGKIREKTFTEKRNALLDWIAFQSRQDPKSPYGARVPIDQNKDYPVAYCHDLRDGKNAEWMFVFQPLVDRGLISSFGDGFVRITDKGWEQLESRTQASGDQGFIAMAFMKEMDPVHAAIHEGIEAAGYRPLRIDKHEYLGGVMDEILARIRESRFVVADLTHGRGGVYYEAGFALGLGVPVIPLCREDHLDGEAEKRVHFDVRHLNLLPWVDANLPALATRLADRIVASIGRGPLAGVPIPHPG
jgi:nucleoside 2-deoxyribosyltransferase